jgi:hypothetical protein
VCWLRPEKLQHRFGRVTELCNKAGTCTQQSFSCALAAISQPITEVGDCVEKCKGLLRWGSGRHVDANRAAIATAAYS